tara:strand:- start:181 stop:576 length:396 start_codon:yes stop_codon:yes gene_type:complete
MRIQSEAKLYEKIYMRTKEFIQLDKFESFNLDWVEGDSEHRGYWKISFNENIYYANKDNQDEFRVYTEDWSQYGSLISIYYGYKTEADSNNTSTHFDCSICLHDKDLEKYIKSVIQNNPPHIQIKNIRRTA